MHMGGLRVVREGPVSKEKERNIENFPATKGPLTHQGCWIKKKPTLLLSIYINKPPFNTCPNIKCLT